MDQADFFAGEEDDAIYGFGIFDEVRLCSQTFSVGWGYIFDGFVALVGQFVCGIRAVGERGCGFNAFSDHTSDESQMSRKNPSNDLCNLEMAGCVAVGFAELDSVAGDALPAI
jgi:hypothetical protein